MKDEFTLHHVKQMQAWLDFKLANNPDSEFRQNICPWALEKKDKDFPWEEEGQNGWVHGPIRCDFERDLCTILFPEILDEIDICPCSKLGLDRVVERVSQFLNDFNRLRGKKSA